MFKAGEINGHDVNKGKMCLKICIGIGIFKTTLFGMLGCNAMWAEKVKVKLNLEIFEPYDHQ